MKYHFLCNLLERRTAHSEMVIVTWHFKLILSTRELSTRATGGGYEIITVVEYVLQLIMRL